MQAAAAQARRTDAERAKMDLESKMEALTNFSGPSKDRDAVRDAALDAINAVVELGIDPLRLGIRGVDEPLVHRTRLRKQFKI